MSTAQRDISLASQLRRVNRITLSAALAIVALVVVASSFTLGLLSLIDTTRLQAKVLAENAGAALMFQDAKSAQELLQPLRNLPALDEALLSTGAGRVFAHYERALKLNPRHRGAHEYVGEAYLMVGKLAQAEGHLKALQAICLLPCEELDDLKAKIDRYRQEGRLHRTTRA